MEVLESKYRERCSRYSDIYEHLPTLSKYASQCQHVTEFGMRSVVSTWALLHGLVNNGEEGVKTLVSVDLNYDRGIEEVRPVADQVGVNFSFVMGNDVKIEIHPTDLLFIDTWHVYGHLKRELEKHHSKVNKYIAMHDTTVDAEHGETLRCGLNPQQQSQESGYPIEEITRGLWPAVEEFLEAHPEWRLEKRYTNNNGLTILSRI